jgi:hypothetical protein
VISIQRGQATQEFTKILAKTDATHWMIQRGTGSDVKDHAGTGGLVLSEECLSGNNGWSSESWTWDFAADPHGENAGGTTVKIIPADSTHPVPRQNLVIGDPTSSGYPISNNILSAPSIFVRDDPKFAGIVGMMQAVEAVQNHPSHTQDQAPLSEQNWFLDGRPLNGPGPTIENLAARVSGQLYKYVASIVVDKDTFSNIGGAPFGPSINRKLQPTMAVSGMQPLTDLSSAAKGNVISDTGADSYKYCIVRIAGECRTGSAVGELFVNAPFVNTRSDGSYGSSQNIGETSLINDLLIYNSDAYMNAVAQVGFSRTDSVGALGRTLTRALMRYKALDVNMNVKSLPNASWLLFWNVSMPGAGQGILAAKIPPYPAVDGVDRTTFVPMSVQLNPPGGMGVDNALIQFGYAENGAADQFYCTSRHEPCLAVAANVPADPFKYPSDSPDGTLGGLAGIPCSSGCTIAIPAISQRVVYYQVLYRDSGNRVVAQTRSQAAPTP